jgi:hypothetical protein
VWAAPAEDGPLLVTAPLPSDATEGRYEVD